MLKYIIIMAKYCMPQIIDRLAQEGYEPDYNDDDYICFNSKNHDSTVLRIQQIEDCYLFNLPYRMRIVSPTATHADCYNWHTLISMLKVHGIIPEVPTNGVFDESSHLSIYPAN